MTAISQEQSNHLMCSSLPLIDRVAIDCSAIRQKQAGGRSVSIPDLPLLCDAAAGPQTTLQSEISGHTMAPLSQLLPGLPPTCSSSKCVTSAPVLFSQT